VYVVFLSAGLPRSDDVGNFLQEVSNEMR
jgi:hypothetical protein